MKASEMIKQLEQLILEHGDMPLAMMEVEGDKYHKVVFVESDGVEGVYTVDEGAIFYDTNGDEDFSNKVFLID